jgi:predicted enzyme related to lactoylglutathione lyase
MTMLKQLTYMNVWVDDQDEALAFYTELKSRGVEFTDEPTERPYGVDAGFRDPSGNQARIVQAA